jgi:hypothetical protein
LAIRQSRAYAVATEARIKERVAQGGRSPSFPNSPRHSSFARCVFH